MPAYVPGAALTCAICLQTDTNSFFELSCTHGRHDRSPMHKACLQQHIQTPGTNSSKCPICRADINGLDMIGINY